MREKFYTKRTKMQSYTINLSESQAKCILLLLDDLCISYAPNNQAQEFMQIKQDAQDCTQGKFATKAFLRHKEQM